MYLYRAITSTGETVDFYLSSTRNAKAPHRFLGKARRIIKPYNRPKILNTDKDRAYISAIEALTTDDYSLQYR